MFKIGNVLIDSLKDEEVSFSNDITSNAVEDGADITDNIRHEPLELSATCVLAGEDANIRYHLLKMMANEDALFTYYGSLEPVLYNMAIESVSNKRDVTFGDGFEFDINLVQVNIVSSKTFQFVSKSVAPEVKRKVEGKVYDAGKKQVKKEKVVVENNLRLQANINREIELFG